MCRWCVLCVCRCVDVHTWCIGPENMCCVYMVWCVTDGMCIVSEICGV